MKKSAIALAVAGVFAAPMAFAATANVDVYGIMDIAIEDTDAGAGATEVTPNVISNYSRIGFKGSEDLGNGLKALWQIETALDGGSGSDIGDTNWATRNSFIGLAGDFGTVVAGRHDTPYKLSTGSLDIFGDTLADYNLGRLDGVQLLANGHDVRNANAVAYISPSFSGLTVAAAVVMDDAAGAADDTADATSVSATYANGPMMLTAAYQDLGNAAGADAVNNAWKLGGAYTIGDVRLGAVYEEVSATATTDRETWLVNAAYTMGPIVLKAQYGEVEVGTSAEADGDMWAIGADYNLSKRTKAYAVYGVGDNGSTTDVAGWTVGMRHSF